jgi:hypothetical protein
MAPDSKSIVSAKLVLPEPEWPNKTTLRIFLVSTLMIHGLGFCKFESDEITSILSTEKVALSELLTKYLQIKMKETDMIFISRMF